MLLTYLMKTIKPIKIRWGSWILAKWCYLVREDTENTELMLRLHQLQSRTFRFDQNDLQARCLIGYTVNLKLLAIKNWAFLPLKETEATRPLCWMESCHPLPLSVTVMNYLQCCLLLVPAAEGSPKIPSRFNTIYNKTFKSIPKKETPKRGIWWMERVWCIFYF